VPTRTVADTITTAATFGSTCRAMIRQLDAPTARAASTKSRCRVFRTSPRMIRALTGHDVRPMTRMSSATLPPKVATMRMIKKKVGNTMTSSVARMRSASTEPPK